MFLRHFGQLRNNALCYLPRKNSSLSTIVFFFFFLTSWKNWSEDAVVFSHFQLASFPSWGSELGSFPLSLALGWDRAVAPSSQVQQEKKLGETNVTTMWPPHLHHFNAGLHPGDVPGLPVVRKPHKELEAPHKTQAPLPTRCQVSPPCMGNTASLAASWHLGNKSVSLFPSPFSPWR